jgi:hypothetical protein
MIANLDEKSRNCLKTVGSGKRPEDLQSSNKCANIRILFIFKDLLLIGKEKAYLCANSRQDNIILIKIRNDQRERSIQ